MHSYTFSTAGAQIVEVVQLNEIAAERVYGFAFIGCPLKLKGATGLTDATLAVPLRD